VSASRDTQLGGDVSPVIARAREVFEAHRRRIFERTDRMFAVLMLVQWVAAIVAALVISPRAWAGYESYTHPHVWAAVFLGGAITLLPVMLGFVRSGYRSTRLTIASGQVLMSGLLIHLTGGRIETHFHVFGSLAFLAFYRDPLVFVPATAIVAVDHLLRGLYWPESVFGVTSGSWRWLEHAAWVLFEDAFLVRSCLLSVREMHDIASKQAQLEFANDRTEATVRERTAELRESEELFRSLSAASPLGIFQSDAVGRATYYNEQWSAITGILSEEALGDGWVRGVHLEDLPRVVAAHDAAMRDVREVDLEFRFVTPRGVRWVHARSNPMRGNDGTVIGRVGTIEDITERKEAEAAREEDAYVSASLADVGRELISSLETPVLVTRLCDLTATVLGADYSTTWMHQLDEDVYVPLATHGLSAEHWDVLRGVRFRIDSFGESLRAQLGRGEITVLRDDGNIPRGLAEILTRHQATLVVCIPILKGGVPIAAQIAGYRDPDATFTAARARLARGIGQLTSMALTNALLFEEVANASRLKSEFVSTMSHELRTPLNVIIGYTDVLADDPPADERALLLAKVRHTSLELLEMITATLDLGRIASGRDVPQMERVDARTLWGALESELAALPRREGVAIRWEDAGDVALLTDRRKLTTIVKNLVGNACKFTASGEITIGCEAGASTGTIIVRDTGIGIAKESLPFIFEMFRQGDSSDSRSYNGAGLGLYIVQRLVTQLGGSVEVESNIGQGSTFRVTLPLAGSVVEPIAAIA